MVEGSLPAYPQGWRSRYRRCDGGGVRAKPGGQSFGPPGAHHVGPLSSAAGPEGLHPQGGWSRISSAPRPSDMGFILHLTQIEFGNDGVFERRWQPILAVHGPPLG